MAFQFCFRHCFLHNIPTFWASFLSDSAAEFLQIISPCIRMYAVHVLFADPAAPYYFCFTFRPASRANSFLTLGTIGCHKRQRLRFLNHYRKETYKYRKSCRKQRSCKAHFLPRAIAFALQAGFFLHPLLPVPVFPANGLRARL